MLKHNRGHGIRKNRTKVEERLVTYENIEKQRTSEMVKKLPLTNSLQDET